LGLNERQIKAVMYEKEGKLQIKSNEKITGIKERLSAIELNVLVENKVFQKFGTTEKALITLCIPH